MNTPHDMLERPINIDDFVVFHNNIYQVLGVGRKNGYGHGPVKIVLVDKSKTTRPVIKQSSDCCLVNKDEVLIWLLKRE